MDAAPGKLVAYAASVAVLIYLLIARERRWARILADMRARTRAAIGEDLDELRAVTKRVMPLLETDPAAAARLLDAHLGPRLQAERAERDELWQRAASERSAAVTLRRLLEDDLAAERAALRTLRRQAHREPPAAEVVEEIVADIARLEHQLGKVQQWLAGPA